MIGRRELKNINIQLETANVWKEGVIFPICVFVEPGQVGGSHAHTLTTTQTYGHWLGSEVKLRPFAILEDSYSIESRTRASRSQKCSRTGE